MSSLLYIEASPRGERSHSSRAAQAYLKILGEKNPSLVIDRLNLWSEILPELDGDLLNAKYAKLAGNILTSDQAAAWSTVEQMIAKVARSELILISTPMWNMGIPYRLKHYIDLVTQPGLSFRFDPGKGYTPLLSPKPVTIIMATSGDFSEGPSWGRPDLATPYLREAFKFIGMPDTNFVLVGPTIGADELVLTARSRADEQLQDLAENLAATHELASVET